MNTSDWLVLATASTDLGQALGQVLGAYALQVRVCTSAPAAAAACAEADDPPRCLLLDAELPGQDNFALVALVRRNSPGLPVLVLTTNDALQQRQLALAQGATDTLDKAGVSGYLVARLAPLVDAGRCPLASTVQRVVLANGQRVLFRLLTPEDVAMEEAFVRDLSQSTRHLRFFSNMKELPPALMYRFTHPQFPHSCAIIGTVDNRNGGEQQIGVARFEPTSAPGVAEFAVVVADAWTGLGVASRLLRGIITVATIAGLQRLDGLVLRHNGAMLGLADSLGFQRVDWPADRTLCKVSKTLRLAAATGAG